MSAQLYILWNEKKVVDLFRYIQDEYAIEVLPAKKVENEQFLSLDDFLCFLVRKRDSRFFDYKKFKDENGDVVETIYPFGRNKNTLVHIEYSQEVYEDKCVGRVYFSACTKSTECSVHMAQVFKEIKKWAIKNSTAREKIDSIWTYSI